VNFNDAVWRLVRRVPRGRVATYGQIAALLGRPRSARAVGQAMAALGGPGGARGVTEVPWHRVVNAHGGISRRPGTGMLTQRLRLEGEGIRVQRGRVDLGRFQWERGPRRRPAGRHPDHDMGDSGRPPSPLGGVLLSGAPGRSLGAPGQRDSRTRLRPGWFDDDGEPG
jgi:methylated-DNA-protein-cysteine methyltransferase-like protein